MKTFERVVKCGGVLCCLAWASCAFARYPANVPDVLKTEKGVSVSCARMWERIRRPELLATFEQCEYGVRPVSRPFDLAFSEVEPAVEMMEGTAIRKRIRASWSGPYGKGGFTFTAFIPKQKRPAPAFVLICNRSPAENIDPTRRVKSDFWPAEKIVARGYAAIAFWNGDLAPDDKSPVFTNGVYACYAKDGTRTETSWGALSAWAWGASRVMDWIETEPLLDAAHVGVVGHSRGGKTALWAGATDTRFAMTCSNDSGCSGAKLNHADDWAGLFGNGTRKRAPYAQSETIDVITRVFPHWFCLNYNRYRSREQEMPFDQHELVALMAPRLVAIASASQDSWADPAAEYQSARLASPVWELYGKKGLVTSGWLPAINEPEQEGCISYHVRQGKHNLTVFDWKCYLDFADRHGWRDTIVGKMSGTAPAAGVLVTGNGRVSLVKPNGAEAWTQEGCGNVHRAVLARDGSLIYSNGNLYRVAQPGISSAALLYSPAPKEGLYGFDLTPAGTIVVAENATDRITEWEYNAAGLSKKLVSIAADSSDAKGRPAKNAHHHFRFCRKTAHGTYLVCVSGGKVVREYARTGEKIREWQVPNLAFDCVRRANGNTLVSHLSGVTEYTPEGRVVWQFMCDDVPEAGLANVCGIQELANGNLVLGTYANGSDLGTRATAIEVTRTKEIVWRFCATRDKSMMSALAL